MAEDDLEDEEVFTDYDEEVCRMTAQPKRQLNKGRGPFYGQCLLYTLSCAFEFSCITGITKNWGQKMSCF